MTNTMSSLTPYPRPAVTGARRLRLVPDLDSRSAALQAPPKGTDGIPVGWRQRPIPNMPPCPDWCADCCGGEIFETSQADGTVATVSMGRLHERTLIETTVNHGTLTGEQVQVRLLIERCDSDEPGAPPPAPRLVLYVENGSADDAELSPAQARQLAAALLDGAALVDAAGPGAEAADVPA